MRKRKIRQYISERTLEFLRTHGAHLEVEVPPHAEKAFIEEYQRATGHEPQYTRLTDGVDKRWYECRVYFKATPFEAAALLVNWTETPQPGRYRINDNDFFWALVEKGFRLENSPKRY